MKPDEIVEQEMRKMIPIVILKKDNNKAWIFHFPNSFLFLKYENDNIEIKHLKDREDVRNEIVNLSKKSWEIIKNEEEW
jgi:hypothetical protein